MEKIKKIKIGEATDKQIVNFIYLHPEEWEIKCFIKPFNYDYEIVRGEDEVEVAIFGVSYIEEGEYEVSHSCPKDFTFNFPIDLEIEVE